jgi:hypothetical protein
MHPNVKDETGNRHGRLTVLALSGNKRGPLPTWTCRCDCGTRVEATGTDLRSGKSKSCGCMRSKRNRTLGNRLPYRSYNHLDSIDEDIF